MADKPTYSRAARLRLALAEQASEISDATRHLVPTGYDSDHDAGEWVEQANNVLSNARELLALAVAYERQRGTSWTEIGERLGIAKQAVHERYAERVRQLGDDLVICWALGDPAEYMGLPDAAADPARHARLLDQWARDHFPAEEGDEHARAVSDHLPLMTTTEHVTMTISAASLLATMTAGKRGHVAGLELGHARRKVELYERMLAEETARPGSTGNDRDEVEDLLAGARIRLADLQRESEA